MELALAILRIRKYPHFDGNLTIAEATTLICDPVAVSRHPFFPFIEIPQRWTKFAIKGLSGVTKERPILFAARKDACIYSKYREILSSYYEEKLTSLGIGASVLAYRRIAKEGGKGNKSNIDFANDVFEEILDLSNCYVYALDIKGFFEHIDHAKLKTVWIDLLGEKKLPPDHHSIFKSITKFAWVSREELYKRLGYIGKKVRPDGKVVTGYCVKRVPLQVCNARHFRRKLTDLIRENDKSHGIPQGSPISDVLANMYLLDFDTKMVSHMALCKGRYYRYSDDILLIVPGTHDDVTARLAAVQKTLNDCGEKLLISEKKSAVHQFTQSEVSGVTTTACALVFGNQGKNGLEYLGFRFDGRRVYIRDSTRAGLNRKIVASAQKLARLYVKANPHKSLTELLDSFNYNLLLTKFGRVEDFTSNEKGYRGWTFWTYATRSQAVFGDKGRPIFRQLSAYKRFVRLRARQAISRYASLP